MEINKGTALALELLADFDEKTIEKIISEAEKEVKKDQAKQKSNAMI
tara:strand:- start:515 stop:655 length:141 start_codon:yes stop_codon:yes gene_type:complete